MTREKTGEENACNKLFFLRWGDIVVFDDDENKWQLKEGHEIKHIKLYQRTSTWNMPCYISFIVLWRAE